MSDPKLDLPERRAGRALRLSAGVVIAGLAACSSSDATSADAQVATDAARADVVTAPPTVRLDVDANRNGVVETTDDERAHRADWSATAGASFLANVDDDDGDHAVDANDEVVNGADDEQDLARIQLEASPRMPLTATASFALTGPPTGTTVRLFRHAADGSWSVFHPATDHLTGDDLRAGVELGIESNDFPTTNWNGGVTLTVTVTDGTTMVGTDAVALRVAPWVIGNSIANTEQTYVMAIGGSIPSVQFVNDLARATDADMMPLTEFDATNPDYINSMEQGAGPDPWTQDIMEFGWTAIPGPGGAPRGMFVVLRSPPPTRFATKVTLEEILAPGMGYVWKHSSPRDAAYDQSLDSFGNLEVIPPYDNGTSHYPLGRMLYDWTPGRYSDPALRAFLDSQGVQGPPLRVDGSWLLVGHVDELFSWVNHPTGRYGWKMLIAAPALSRRLLTDLVAAAPGNGDALIFQGRYFYDVQSDGTVHRRAAQRTLNNLLGDMDLMAFNQQVQAHIDMLRMQVQTETGLPDTDFVEIPILWEQVDMGRALAYQPGTVNLLYYGHTAVVARPHGPVFNGIDAVETDMTQRMSALGVTTRFAEQWDLLHAEEGEVHCGTNALRSIPTDTRWWEVVR